MRICRQSTQGVKAIGGVSLLMFLLQKLYSCVFFLSLSLQIEGNVLRITRTRVEDRGLYLCNAENSAGTGRAAAMVEVESKTFLLYCLNDRYQSALISNYSVGYHLEVLYIPCGNQCHNYYLLEIFSLNEQVALPDRDNRSRSITDDHNNIYWF